MKSNKLVILCSDAEAYLDRIAKAALPMLSVEISREFDSENRHISECDILLGSPDLVSRALPHAGGLKWVQSTWAGVTPFMEPGMRRDYMLTGVKGVFGRLMAEYVICHLLMHERGVLQRYRNQLEKKWDMTPPGTLRGKVIGIMGLGSIGRDIVEMARTFGMRARGFSRSQKACAGVEHCFLPRELTAFVRDLDYLVCVLPDTPETTGLISEPVLKAMRDTALIINVGRGNAVCEASLARALTDKTIGGAVLDVFREEPLPAGHPLWQTPNTIITSHTAAMSSPELVAPIFIENYHRFVRGQPLRYMIDFSKGY